jgi:hypothetical protein
MSSSLGDCISKCYKMLGQSVKLATTSQIGPLVPVQKTALATTSASDLLVSLAEDRISKGANRLDAYAAVAREHPTLYREHREGR